MKSENFGVYDTHGRYDVNINLKFKNSIKGRKEVIDSLKSLVKGVENSLLKVNKG